MPRRKVLPDDDAAAKWAAGHIAALLVDAVAERGRASLALSGGRSPWVMMADLFARTVPWDAVDILQVDERVVAADDPRRNMRRIAALLNGSPAAAARMHPMPVEAGARRAAREYAAVVEALEGPIDVLQLGLGTDGHTASLAPGDPVLEVTDVPVACTAGPFAGTVRVTLTYPAIDAAREVVWLVTGSGKREMAVRLEAGDAEIPAGRVTATSQVLVLDATAAGGEPD